jgi:hypothetical protein
MTCTFNLVNGGNVVVNSNLLLGYYRGGSVHPTAALNVTGGTLAARNISDQSGNASSAVSLSSCTLTLTSPAGSMGTAAQPIGSITLNNTTLNLAIAGAAAPIVTSALTITGSSDVINVTDAPLIANLPATNTLIKSVAPINGAYDFILGTFPANYTAHIQESADSTAVQLVITAAPKFPTTGTKITAVSLQPSTSSLLFSGTNGVPNSAYYVLTSTNLLLPITNWTAIATNAFDGNGNFTLTLPYSANGNPAFYVIKSQ